MARTTTLPPSPWDACADDYAKLLDDVAPVTARLLDALALRPGERALDVATGPGEPALALSRAVGPSGSVVGVDASEAMVRVARDRAARERSSATFFAMDAADLRFDDASFDAVASRFGYQLLDDPVAAAREARRVLRPRVGRMALAVWGPASGTPMGELFERVGIEDAPMDAAAVLRAAGFRNVRATPHALAFAPDAFARFVRATPLAAALGARLDAEIERAWARATTREATYAIATGGA